MSSESSGGDGADPLDIFEEANTAFQSTLEEIDEDSPGAARREMEAVDEFLKAIASIDPDPMITRQAISIVNDRVDFMTKSDAEKQLHNHIRQSRIRGDGRPLIDELLKENIVQIEKLVSDESEAEPRYRFVFADGASFIIDAETLYSPTKFRRAYNGVYDVLPKFFGEQEEWEDLLHELQEDYLVSKPDAVGPRSAAIQQLRAKVEQSEAYLDVGEAARRSGVFIDAASKAEAESAEELLVSSEEIRAICDEFDVTPEALRVEMDNRDLRSRSTVERRFDGDRAYFWPLPRGEDGFEEKLIEHEEAESEDDGGE